MSVVKIMSATGAEFLRSLKFFAPDLKPGAGQTSFDFPTGEGVAVVSYYTLPPRQVTGLLQLPQLEVVIEFRDVENLARDEFMAAFDLAFRRGGG